MNYFEKCQTIEEARGLWHALMKQYHPDAGGDTRTCQTINDQFDEYCRDYVYNAYADYATEHEWSDWEDGARYKSTIFGEMLARVCKLNVTVELVGYWIWVSDCWTPALKEQLNELGFWYSKRHRVYIYNGGKKRKSKKFMTTDHVKMINGVERIRDKEEETENAPAAQPA